MTNALPARPQQRLTQCILDQREGCDEALLEERTAVRVHDLHMKNNSCQTDFRPLRSNPKFVAIRRNVGLPADTRGMR